MEQSKEVLAKNTHTCLMLYEGGAMTYKKLLTTLEHQYQLYWTLEKIRAQMGDVQ